MADNAGNMTVDLEQKYINEGLSRVFHDRLSPEILALQVEQSGMKGGVSLNLAIEGLEEARDLIDKLQKIYKKQHEITVESEDDTQALQQPKLPSVLQEESKAKVSSSWFGFWKQKDKSAPAPESKLGVPRTTPKKPGSP